MLVFLIIVLICMIPLLLKQNKKTLLCSFILLWIFASLRCDFGDYSGYYNIWAYVQDKSFGDLFYFASSIFDIFAKKHISLSSEFGYLFLSKIIPGNFEIFIFFTTGFYLFSVYRFITLYVPQKYFYLSFLLFVDPIIFLSNLSAIRQTLALSILLLFIPMLIDRKYIKFIIGVILASLCHKSAIIFVFLPVLFFLIEQKLTFFIVVFSLGFIPLLFLLFRSGLLISNEFYGSYTEQGQSGNLFYTIALSIPAIFSLLAVDKKKNINLFFALLYSFIAILRIFCLLPGGQLITRYNLYFEEFAIVIFPLIIVDIHKRYLRNIIIVACIMFFLGRTFLFFATPDRVGETKINFLQQNIFVSELCRYME